MSHLVRSILVALLSVILVLGILLALVIPLTVRRSFPKTDGELQASGLDMPIDIFRDSSGAPHIYAQTSHDLFFAQGYVHAQDRFWQMDFWRHTGSGRLSEMFGEDTLETDKFLRTLGWARVVEQELRLIDQGSLDLLEAYAEGVNAYLADHKGSSLSLEYAILKLLNPAYQPEPWTPLHTLTWAKAMAWDLGGNMDVEIERAMLMKTFTPQQMAELYPPYPAEKPLIVPAQNVSALIGSASTPGIAAPFTEHLLSAWRDISNKRARLEALLGPLGASIGSNNFVLSGQLTSTGMPLLANDPHLAAQMPSIWYEVGLHCAPKGPHCPYDVTGVSFAGVPAVIIGHNDRIAWAFTNVNPDVQDLYIEKINPQNPNQYEVNGSWVDMQLVEETIQVSGGEPAPLSVRYTRHGPLITETYLPDNFSDMSGIDLPEQYAVALRWTALEPSYVFRAIFAFNRAQNWDDFRNAARDFAVPSQNLIFADVDGNIGYQMPGWVPIRANGDGSLPVPGWTDEYEWKGYIPFDELPYAYNPPQGYLVTANNAVVGSNYTYLLSTDWDYGYRAQRIVDMIEAAPGQIDIAYIQKMQGDDKNLIAETLVPVLQPLPLEDARLERARQLLQDWDFQMHMDSAPAALFAAFWRHLLANTFHDDLPEDAWPGGDSEWFVVMSNLAQQSGASWWDNRNTPQVESRDQIMVQAFSDAVAELEDVLDKEPSRWAWGDLHTLTFTNQTLGTSGISPIETLFNRGPYRTSGGSSIVNATGWNASRSYQVTSLPSMRMIVDLGDLESSLIIHTTGQSGHAYHRHYVDMADAWRMIQYHPMLWGRSQVEASAEAHLRLVP